MRRFPIMDGGPSIPWAMIEPYKEQAKTNHDQTLEELARRGGLSAYEAVCVLEGKRLSFSSGRDISYERYVERLKWLLAAWMDTDKTAEIERLQRRIDELESIMRNLWSVSEDEGEPSGQAMLTSSGGIKVPHGHPLSPEVILASGEKTELAEAIRKTRNATIEREGGLRRCMKCHEFFLNLSGVKVHLSGDEAVIFTAGVCVDCETGDSE